MVSNSRKFSLVVFPVIGASYHGSINQSLAAVIVAKTEGQNNVRKNPQKSLKLPTIKAQKLVSSKHQKQKQNQISTFLVQVHRECAFQFKANQNMQGWSNDRNSARKTVHKSMLSVEHIYNKLFIKCACFTYSRCNYNQLPSDEVSAT